MFAGSAIAEEFAPSLLRIDTDRTLQYDFDGSLLRIPVTVEGTNAGLIFSIFTRNFKKAVGSTINGYLGWHYVNRIDTCIYYSSLKSVGVGENVITWDGLDQDGNIVPEREYDYYMWAFDNQGIKQIMTHHMYAGWGFDMTTAVMEHDDDGLPLANPLWYRANERWFIGSDPEDESLKESTSIGLPSGWEYRGEPYIDPGDVSSVILNAANTDIMKATLVKLRWIPEGISVIDDDWGEFDGYATYYDIAGGGSPGVVADNYYIYTIDENHATSNNPDADLYIYDRDGFLIIPVDLTPWWSNPDDLEMGGQMNGGPNNFFMRNKHIFLNCHCSCLNQMVDPQRYLETVNKDDFFIWSNGNGDYTLDHNFEETSAHPWICNDYNVGPYKQSISTDDNLFSIVNAYDAGTVSFGLLAPDGTGLGYFAFAGETAGMKTGAIIIDGGTPYDGIYCDNYDEKWAPWKKNDFGNNPTETEIYFVGHDSIKGIIYTGGPFDNPNPSLTLSSPISGETFECGSKQTITWRYWQVKSITIEFSFNGGETWIKIANSIPPSECYLWWRIPYVISNDCLIRISDPDNPDVSDISESCFSIVLAPGQKFFTNEFTDTGKSAIIKVPWTINPIIDGESPTSGDEIAVFTPSGLCIGSTVWKEGEDLFLTVWGDNIRTTRTVDGALEGEVLMFKVWDNETGKVYDVHAVSSSGDITFTSNEFIILDMLVAGDDIVAVKDSGPETFTLAQNSPNPFNPSTTISFTLPRECRAELTVYNLAGAKVATLVRGNFPAGKQEVTWNADGFPSGVYFCHIAAGEFRDTIKMMLVK